MKKIFICFVFVFNAFQLAASQEDSLLGLITFCGTIAYIQLNQLIHEQKVSYKNSKHPEVLMDKTLICQVLGTVPTDEVIKHDLYVQNEGEGPYELVSDTDIKPVCLEAPIDYNDDLSGSIIMVSHRDVMENERRG